MQQIIIKLESKLLSNPEEFNLNYILKKIKKIKKKKKKKQFVFQTFPNAPLPKTLSSSKSAALTFGMSNNLTSTSLLVPPPSNDVAECDDPTSWLPELPVLSVSKFSVRNTCQITQKGK